MLTAVFESLAECHSYVKEMRAKGYSLVTIHTEDDGSFYPEMV